MNVGPCLAKHIGNAYGCPTDFNSKDYISVKPVKSSEVPEIIRNLKNSSPGGDEIPASLIKKVASSAFDPLLFIFSCPLNQPLSLEPLHPSRLFRCLKLTIHVCSQIIAL